jgi:ketosteroid isomerase-like protein
MIARSLLLIVALAFASPALAEPAKRAEIAAALERWTEDFNDGRTDKVCGLFARDLRSDYRGQPEGNYETLCAQLHRSLTDPSRRYAYALAIKEILVWGDIAVVRLVWTLKLTLKAENREITTREPGLDVFRREPDGKWRITRFMAYEE